MPAANSAGSVQPMPEATEPVDQRLSAARLLDPRHYLRAVASLYVLALLGTLAGAWYYRVTSADATKARLRLQ